MVVWNPYALPQAMCLCSAYTLRHPDPCGDYVQRAPHPIAAKEAGRFFCRSNDTIRAAGDPAGKPANHFFAPCLAGRKIVRIMLIDSVIGVQKRGVRLFCNITGCRESAELAVGMDNVRPPGE